METMCQWADVVLDHSRGQEPGHLPSTKPDPSAHVQSARSLPGSDWPCVWGACGEEEAGVLGELLPWAAPFQH